MFTIQLRTTGPVKITKIPLLANLLTGFKITMLVLLLQARRLYPPETVTQFNNSFKLKTKNLFSKLGIISYKRIIKMGFS